MKNVIVNYEVNPEMEQQETYVTCGTKLFFQQLKLDNYKADTVGETRAILSLLDDIELTETEKEIIEFKDVEKGSTYNVKKDIDSIENFRPIVFNKANVSAIFNVLTSINIPIQMTMNLSFINTFIDKGFIIKKDVTFKEQTDNEVVDIKLAEITLDDDYVIEQGTASDVFNLINVLMNVTEDNETDYINVNSVFKSMYFNELVEKAITGDTDKESLILIRQIFTEFFDENTARISPNELKVIDKYIEYKF